MEEVEEKTNGMQNMETSADKPDDRETKNEADNRTGDETIPDGSEGAVEALDTELEDDDPELEDAAEDRIQALMTENADLRDKLPEPWRKRKRPPPGRTGKDGRPTLRGHQVRPRLLAVADN